MNCRECLERLSPYHDGALDAADASGVSAHLDACAACGWEWEAHRRAMRAIAGAPTEPPGLASRVDSAWRSARAGRPRGWAKHDVVFLIAALATVLVLRSC